MRDMLMSKGSIFVAAIASKLAQISVDLPANADEVSTWVSIGGGAVYVGLNIPKIVKVIKDLFK